MWLMALAIPVQGMASVQMPLCAPALEAVAAAAHAPAVQADHTGHGMHASADHHHAPDQPRAHDGDLSGHVGHDGNQSGHAGHGALKCCSVACSMAVMAIPGLLAQVQATASNVLPLVAQLHPGITPAGLDRPPKRLLA